MGLLTAGLAFALQKVVTAIAGYFVILRGQTFGVGDRIASATFELVGLPPVQLEMTARSAQTGDGSTERRARDRH